MSWNVTLKPLLLGTGTTMNPSNTFPPSALFTSATSILIALSLNSTCYAPPVTTPITWGPATSIFDDADVLNTGTLVAAFNLGTTSVPGTTVNGVTFASFAIPDDAGSGSTTVGDFTLSLTGARHAKNTELGSGVGSFSGLTASYQTLLKSGAYAFGGGITLTMQGLTAGQPYTFEWWSNDSGPFLPVYTTTATSGNSVALNDNTTASAGGLGQYAIGTFTAINATQVITFSGEILALC